MWRGDPHFGLPGYMRGETQKEKGESPHPAWEPPRTNWWRLLNSTQLSFAVAASGALPSRWAGVLTLRWPSFSGGFTMFHIFQAASLWSPVQLVGPRAPRCDPRRPQSERKTSSSSARALIEVPPYAPARTRLHAGDPRRGDGQQRPQPLGRSADQVLGQGRDIGRVGVHRRCRRTSAMSGRAPGGRAR